MKVADLIEDAKRYVVGYFEDDGEEYVHWTEADWISYARMAVGILATAESDLFTTVVDIKLEPGSVQYLPSECSALRSVRGQRGDNNSITSLIRKRSFSSINLPRISRPSCHSTTSSTNGYTVKSYAVDPADPTSLIVDPPVPDGVSATMVITCYSPPVLSSVEDDIQINDTHLPIIFELMLYYAWGVDIEDQANRERSDTHWNNAIKLLDIKDARRKEQLKMLAIKAVTNG